MSKHFEERNGRETPPTVLEFFEVEMIRDGGSLAVTFGSKERKSYILFFPIHIVDHGTFTEEGKIIKEKLGFKQPILVDCDPAKRAADTDRIKYGELSGPATQVTWADARTVIAAVGHLAGELKEPRLGWLRMMEFVAENDGKLPPDIEPLSQWRRHKAVQKLQF